MLLASVVFEESRARLVLVRLLQYYVPIALSMKWFVDQTATWQTAKL